MSAVHGEVAATPGAPVPVAAAAAPPFDTRMVTLLSVSEPPVTNTPYSDCPAAAVVLFWRVSASSVHEAPALLAVTTLCALEVCIVVVALVQLLQGTAPPCVYVHPP